MSALWSKAIEAAASARLLFEAGHYDGATSRAYYVMFDAARLPARGARRQLGRCEAARGADEKFSLLAVMPDETDKTHGRALSRAFDGRIVADYSERTISEAEARKLLERMDAFLAAIETHLESRST